MKHPAPIPYESRIVRALRSRHDAIEADREMIRIAKDTGADLPPAPRDPTVRPVTLIGDEGQLRGIPVVGVKGGYGGAIRGSRPGDGLT